MSAPQHQQEPGLPPALVIVAIMMLALAVTAMAYVVINFQ